MKLRVLLGFVLIVVGIYLLLNNTPIAGFIAVISSISVFFPVKKFSEKELEKVRSTTFKGALESSNRPMTLIESRILWVGLLISLIMVAYIW